MSPLPRDLPIGHDRPGAARCAQHGFARRPRTVEPSSRCAMARSLPSACSTSGVYLNGVEIDFA